MGTVIQKQEKGKVNGSYHDVIDKMKWSYSRLSSFENCKYEFYLKYIVKDNEIYPPESNYYSEVGSYVHEILAKIFSGELTPDEASQYYIDNFDKNIFHKTKQSTMDKTFEACADYFCLADFSWLNNYEILGVEKKVEFKIENYDFVGFIDLLVRDKRDNRIIVIDNKSSKYPFRSDGRVKVNSQNSFQGYQRQMYLYSYAVKEQYGEYPKEIAWNHFKDGGRFAKIPFSQDDYMNAIKWAIETIHAIEAETEYASSPNFFYCDQLCVFRRSCEYSGSTDE